MTFVETFLIDEFIVTSSNIYNFHENVYSVVVGHSILCMSMRSSLLMVFKCSIPPDIFNLSRTKRSVLNSSSITVGLSSLILICPFVLYMYLAYVIRVHRNLELLILNNNDFYYLVYSLVLLFASLKSVCLILKWLHQLSSITIERDNLLPFFYFQFFYVLIFKICFS